MSVVAACAGEEHSAILTDTDDLFTFGRNGERAKAPLVT